MFLNSLKEQSNKVRQKYDELTNKTNPKELEKRISDKLTDKERYKTKQSKYLGMMMTGFNNFEIPSTNIKNSYSYNSVKIEPKHNNDTFNRNLKNNIEPTQAFLFSGFKNENDFKQQKTQDIAQDEQLTNKYINLLIGNSENYVRDINGKLIEKKPYENIAKNLMEIDKLNDYNDNINEITKPRVRELKIQQLNKKIGLKDKKQAEKELLQKFNENKIDIDRDTPIKDIQNSRYKKAQKKRKQELKEMNDENRQILKNLKGQKRKYNAKNFKNQMEIKQDVINELNNKIESENIDKEINKIRRHSNEQNKDFNDLKRIGYKAKQTIAQKELKEIGKDAKKIIGRKRFLDNLESEKKKKIQEERNRLIESKKMKVEDIQSNRINQLYKKAIDVRIDELKNDLNFKGKSKKNDAITYANDLGIIIKPKTTIAEIRKLIAEKEINSQDILQKPLNTIKKTKEERLS